MLVGVEGNGAPSAGSHEGVLAKIRRLFPN